jgi:hypothetical protein
VAFRLSIITYRVSEMLPKYIPSLNSGMAQMTEEIPSIKLLFSDQFKDRLRILAKRYRSIRTDLQPLIDDLQIGKFIGDQIPGIG